MPYQLLARELKFNIVIMSRMREHGSEKVLIVDDEPDICFLFSRILRGRNLQIGLCPKPGRSYVLLSSEDPPSLVFLDNSLPDGQGIDFIPYLKKNSLESGSSW